MIKTVTIAIPAYNESSNIIEILRSLLTQNYNSLKLEQILVVNDGSNDDTSIKVRAFAKNNRFIKLIDHSERLGKVTRLNEIYKLNKSDYLIIFDADISLGTNNVVSDMCEVLTIDPQALLIAAHQIPIKVKTFAGLSIYWAYKVWDDTRLSVSKYNNIQNFYGAASAYRKVFADSLKIPNQITDERGYLYIMAEKNNGFRYTKKAFIYYLPVNTFHDFWKLADRSFSKNRNVLSKIFGEKVLDLYEIPSKYKIYAIIKNFFKSPFFTTIGILLNIISRTIPNHDKLYEHGAWETSISTKNKITI